MKAVLISIQPKWCKLIASGEKTVEVRKTKPKLETPFKVYIYCTQEKHKIDALHILPNGTVEGWQIERANIFGEYCNGRVIGEFACDKIYDIKPHYDIPNFCNQYEYGWKIGEAEDCLSFEDLDFYLDGKCGYGWHISDLKIYDEPIELSEFKRPCDGNCQHCDYALWETESFVSESKIIGCSQKVSAPQSWCYVEQLQNEYSGGHHE